MSTISSKEVYDNELSVSCPDDVDKLLKDSDVQSVVTVGNNVTKVTYAPEIVKVPRDLYRKVLSELESRKSDLLEYRDHGVAEYITDLIDDFKKCDEKQNN